MNTGFTTKFVEPKQTAEVVAIDEVPDEKLATQAIEDIRNTERLSGFGRFATKVQGMFQSSASSQATQQSSHLKAAPIMMSAGVLLLLATGLLFVLSKPESAVQSHFRPSTGLTGADDRKPATRFNTESPVTENQLASNSSNNSDSRSTTRNAATTRAHPDRSGGRFAFANDGGGAGNPASPGATTGVSELQNPATVFTANPVSNSVLSLLPGIRPSRESEVQLPSGTEITAHTTNAISSGLESPVIAIVDRNVQLGDTVVIPQGARVVGYTAGAVKDRINVRFTSVILPNSREVTISGLGLMKDGSAGLVGKVQGSGRPVLATAGRIATGASVLAIQFAGQNSMNQPFSQADYLRNQLASEVASEGSRYSNRLQQPMNVPIVTVNTNQSIRIFLLSALSIADGRIRSGKLPQQGDAAATPIADQNQSSQQALAATQATYIQALESQLADMRAALDARKSDARH